MIFPDTGLLKKIGEQVFNQRREMHLSNNFSKGLANLDKDDALQVVGIFEMYRLKMNSMKPVERLLFARKELEAHQFSVASEAPKVSCKKGCSNCCYQYVGVTATEADRIARERWPESVAGTPTFDLQYYWTTTDFMKQYPRGKCGFLAVDGQCSIYNERPLACRSALAVGNPDDCLPNSPNRPQMLLNMITEAVMCAYWNSEGERPDSLARQMNESLA